MKLMSQLWPLFSVIAHVFVAVTWSVYLGLHDRSILASIPSGKSNVGPHTVRTAVDSSLSPACSSGHT